MKIVRVIFVFIAFAVFVLLCFWAGAQQTAHYRMEGSVALNDLATTPGAVGTMTTVQLCAKSFHTGTVRNVTEATKQAVCREYGVAEVHCTGKLYEIDHLISLELGGVNDLTNLWPQQIGRAHV